MKNELNFIVAIVLTLIVLTCYPLVMRHFFPAQFPAQNAETEKAPAVQNNAVIAPAAEHNNGEITTTYRKQKAYQINSRLFSLEVNTPQADISRIELNQIKDPSTGKPTVLMDCEKNSPGIFTDYGLTNQGKLIDVKTGRGEGIFNYKLKNGLKVIKTIKVSGKLYQIKTTYQIVNPTDRKISVKYRLIAATGVPEESGISARFRNVLCIFDKGHYKKNLHSLRTTVERPGIVNFAGFQLKYFSMILVPFGAADEFFVNGSTDTRETSAGVNIASITIPARGRMEQKFVLYAGPNDSDKMKALGVGVEQVRGKGFFAGFSDLLLYLLRALHGILRNYGLAVIALALIVNLFLFPLTVKSMRSMKEMQVLQPKVEALKQKYGKDHQKLNKEMVELYRSHNVNYADGCLPILFQMPVFFTLYGVLMRAIELRGAHFLWIKDLAAPDAFIVLSAKLPFIGDKINLLPLLMVGASFLQQKVMTKGQQTSDQQKAMTMLMPLFLGFIFYNFPSGLVLYFLTNTLFSFGVQMRLKNVGAK